MGIKRCQKCGSRFSCDGDKDCWCEKVQIHKVQMLNVMEQYSDCICPQCLNEYKARE